MTQAQQEKFNGVAYFRVQRQQTAKLLWSTKESYGLTKDVSIESLEMAHRRPTKPHGLYRSHCVYSIEASCIKSVVLNIVLNAVPDVIEAAALADKKD